MRGSSFVILLVLVFLQVKQLLSQTIVVDYPEQTLFAAGDNYNGQLGLDNREPEELPSVLQFFRDKQLNITAMSVGDSHVLAIASDDNLYVWGENGKGQLGTGDIFHRVKPLLHPFFSNQTFPAVHTGALSAGSTPSSNSHSAVVDRNGAMYTFGYNAHGQLGNGLKVDSITPVEVRIVSPICSGLPVVLASVSAMRSYAVTEDGTLYAWGRQLHGELGTGTQVEDTVLPTIVSGLQCISTSVSVVTTGTVGTGSTPSMLNVGATAGSLSAGMVIKFTSGAVINMFRTVLSVNGQLAVLDKVMWGISECRRPATGDTFQVLQGCTTDQVIQVAVGESHTVALMASGPLFAWGRNNRGQLCRGFLRQPNLEDSSVPISVTFDWKVQAGPFTGKIVNVTAGDHHTLALTDNGRVFSWGAGTDGQLGQGVRRDDGCSHAVEVTFARPVKYITAGARHSLVVIEPYYPQRFADLTVFNFTTPSIPSHVVGFGDNSHGQLGIGGYKDSLLPTTVSNLSDTNMERVWAGRRSSYFLSKVTPCPGACFGHGRCNFDNGVCDCQYPWTFELDCLTAYCPNDCSGNGECNRYTSRCTCAGVFYMEDCSLAACPSNCTSEINGICDSSSGDCFCIGNVSVSYIGKDCFSPDPLHVFSPLDYYILEMQRIAPFFHKGNIRNLTIEQNEELRQTAISPAALLMPTKVPTGAFLMSVICLLLSVQASSIALL